MSVLIGAENNDSLAGGSEADTLQGLGGADSLYGNAGDDSVSGGAGDDLLVLGEGADTVDGGTGDDLVFAGPGDDVIDGGDGVDRIGFQGGPAVRVDLMLVGPQATNQGLKDIRNIENLVGTVGADTLAGNDGSNLLWGFNGGADLLQGRGGDDFLIVTQGDATVDGGDGVDTFAGSYSAANGISVALWRQGQAQASGVGNLTLTSIENLSGTVFGDNLQGDNQNNVITGMKGDDTLNGGSGDDRLLGDGEITFVGGRPEVFSAPTASTPAGNAAGADLLFGDDGNDTIEGGQGNDYTAGGAGDDRIDGGEGRDVAAFYLPNGTPGSFRVVSGGGADAGSIIVERVDGATVEAVFRITPAGGGAVTVTGLGSAAGQGVDTVVDVEELHVMVPQDPFNPNQFISIPLSPSIWTDPGGAHQAHVTGAVGDDQLDLASLVPQADASWQVNADGGLLGNDTVLGTNGNNWINGGSGDDSLNGRDGDDTLLGAVGDDVLDGGAGQHDAASFELPGGVAGSLRVVAGGGPDAGKLIVQRLEGAVVEDLLAVTRNGDGSFSTEGRGAGAGWGVDSLRNVETINVYAPGGASLWFNITPSTWVDDQNHNVGVNGSDFGETISAGDYHQDRDGTWNRFFNGEGGDDVLLGTSGRDNLFGQSGQDTLSGAGGDDNLYGGAGNDLLLGGLGRDTAQFELPGGMTGQLRSVVSGPETITIQRVDGAVVEDLFTIVKQGTSVFTVTGVGAMASAGSDTLNSMEAVSFYVLNGGPNLYLNIEPSAWVYAPNHNAGVDGTPFSDQIDLSEVHEGLDASWPRFVNAGAGDDLVRGADLGETLNGQAGNDTLLGLGGNDFLVGGAGDDRLEGGEGADYAYGGAGSDTMIGGAGDDVFVLADRDPAVPRTNGSDIIDGGEGFDVVSFWSVTNPIFVDLGNTGWQGTGFGAFLLTSVEGVEGGRGADNLLGDAGGNFLSGGFTDAPTGNDYLEGRGGDDTLAGRDGDDYLVGGDGNDLIVGGAGTNDVAAFRLQAGVPGTLRVVEGVGADAGSVIVQRVDGAVVEAVFGVTPTATGGATVTGLGAYASQGTDTVSTVEQLHFLVPQDPFNPNQFVSVNLAPSLYVDPNGAKFEHLSGSLFGEVLDLATIANGGDASWSINADGGVLGADTILGHEGVNKIHGGAGDDSLSGRGGDDYLVGDAGHDVLDGGAGGDTAAFELPTGTAGTLRAVAGQGADAGALIIERVDGAVTEAIYKVTQVSTGVFQVQGLGSRAGDGTDLARNVEGLNFSIPNGPNVYINVAPSAWVDATNHNVGADGTPFGDVLDLSTYHADKDATWRRFANGGDGADSISGTAGNDGLNGDAGDDTLLGQGGDDYLRGGAGNDLIDGGAGGNDIAAYTLPPGVFTQVDGVGAEAGKLFIVRTAGGVAERVFEITFSGSGASLEATVKGLGSAASYGVDVVRNVEQIQFVTEPFNNATFTSVKMTVTVPAAGTAPVQGSAAGEVLDVAAIYPNAPANVVVRVNALGGADTVLGREVADDLSGGAGDDSLMGRGGNDLLRGGAGVDTYDGGAGTDRISFYEVAATQGVEADLATGRIANDGFGNAETMISIEGLGGATRFVDKLYGNDEGNVLLGGWKDIVLGRGGDDVVQLGGAAAVADGGAGFDTLVFTTSRTVDLNGDGLAEEEAATHGVFVDLAQQRIVDDGFGQTGQVMGFEVVFATQFADTLSGDGFANDLEGEGGADSLNGGSGDDILVGGEGNDTLVGGAGVDEAVYFGARSDFTITQTATGYRVVDNNLADGDEGADELSGVELIHFSDQTLALQTGVAISPAAIARPEGASGVSYMEFTVTRTGDTSGTLTLPYAITGAGLDPVDAGDIVGFDGVALNGSVTFAAGATSTVIRVPVAGDTVIEGNETFQVTLGQPATGSVDFTRQTATGTIQNDDNPVGLPPGWGGGWGYGDPHLVTMDGLHYEMQGVGEFVLVESTRGAPVSVQIRTEAVNAYASEVSAMATKLGTAKVSIDAESNTVLVNGQALTFSAGELTKVVGDGSVSLYSANGQSGWLIKFSDATKAAVVVLDLGDRLDVSFLASPDRAGDFRGLLGDYNGSAGNDLALRNGTVLTQPISFGDFYSQFVNSWRISNAESLFTYGAGQSTATFTDLAFPPGPISLDAFPSDLVAAAEQAARDAGLSDPALIASAVKDYLLTGETGFIASGAGVTTTAPPVQVQVQAPAQPLTAVGVGTTTPSLDEGQSGQTTFAFKVYRTSGSGQLTVNWSVAGQVFQGVEGAANAADFGGVLPAGTVTFAEGQTEVVVLVNVSGDALYEGAEGFVFSITPPAGTVTLSSSVQARIANDDAPPPPPTSYPNGPEQKGGNGADTLIGTPGAEKMDGGNGDDRIDGGAGGDTLLGGNGDDTLLGQAGRDDLRGDNGSDLLDGGADDDKLSGGNGADTLIGGGGDDMLTGGSGADVFRFDKAFGHDRITDFDASDVIRFERGVFVDYVDLKAHAVQSGADVIITDALGDTLTLVGVKLSTLNAGDFLFG